MSLWLYEKVQQYNIISDTAECKTWNKCLNHNAQPKQSHAQMGGEDVSGISTF